MSITLIQNEADWRKEQETWEAVYNANPNHTPYQSLPWLTTWWQHLGSGSLHILRVDDAEGKTIGYAPFALQNRFFGFPIKHLAFIGAKRTDYLDFVVRAGAEAFFFAELLQYLQGQRKVFSFVEIKDLPDTSTNLPVLLREIGKYFPIFAAESSRICVTVPLPADWETFLGTLGKRTRRDVGYDRRLLEKNFTTELKEYRNGQDARVGYGDLVKIYDERWIGEKGATRYSEAAAAAFEREVCEQFSLRGDLRLWVLYLNGEPTAAVSGYVRNRKLFADAYAHSPRFHKFSVGNVLLGNAIERCIAEGLSEFDLSRGEEAYKYRWNGKEKRNYHLKLFHSHRGMMWAAAAEHLYLVATRSTKLQNLYSLFRKIRYGS